jgi:hypothetical protein
MKHSLSAAVIGALLVTNASAQDFLQQWRDAATKQRNEFRATHSAAILAAGWRFVGGSTSAEGVPMADVFVARTAKRAGGIHSAELLTSFYALLPESVVPEHQSMRSVAWFDCAAGTWEQRTLARYPTLDGTGDPNSAEPGKAEADPPVLGPIDHGAVVHAVLATVCGEAR